LTLAGQISYEDVRIAAGYITQATNNLLTVKSFEFDR
jgi:hypothetical protein